MPKYRQTGPQIYPGLGIQFPLRNTRCLYSRRRWFVVKFEPVSGVNVEIKVDVRTSLGASHVDHFSVRSPAGRLKCCSQLHIR